MLLHMTALLAISLAACGGPEGEAEGLDPGRELAEDSLSTRTAGCWSDRDCRVGLICEGARICPPGALCGPLPDTPGKCVAPSLGCEVDGRRYAAGEVFGGCDACTCQKDGTVVCLDFVCLECWSDADCPNGYGCTLDSGCPTGALCRPVRQEPGYCEPLSDASDTAGGL